MDFNRTFSMGAFEALRVVRIRGEEFPGWSFEQLVELVVQVEVDGAAHDFEAAYHLDGMVDSTVATVDALSFYRGCIEAAIITHRPMWVKTIPLGRRKFTQKLAQDHAQCFASAGLLDDPPPDDVIAWWDKISELARMFGSGVKSMQGREAERLSLRYELERLKKLRIDKTPIWMSIEDNTVGYDILSYDAGEYGPVARVLEVKSTISSPLRFFVSRNEWDVCRNMGNSYHFHIWDMRTKNLFQRTIADIAPHIPNDQGTGRWTTVEIRVGAGMT